MRLEARDGRQGATRGSAHIPAPLPPQAAGMPEHPHAAAGPAQERYLPTSKHQVRLPLLSQRLGQLLPLGRTVAAPPDLLSPHPESRAWARI